jgi:AbrB family looped-hinge helix DNA binding protein
MTATTITTKGQVTIPKRLRDSLGLKPGNKVTFGVDESGHATIIPIGKPAKSRFAGVRGKLKNDPLTTDEIMVLLRGD